MYQIDGNDTITKLAGIPQPDTGAPVPYCFQSERRVLLAYILADSETGSDFKDEYVVVDFEVCWAALFGGPNDEVLHGHPLYKRGLRSYGAFEVDNSSWIRSAIQINSVHDRHDPESFD